MASSPAKIGWTRLRKRENKNYCSVLFLPEENRKFQKNNKKNVKITKYRCGFV